MPGSGVAVVTGGASGFGLALARNCAARGMDVALFDVDGDRAEEATQALAGEFGVTCLSGRVDVASTLEVASAAARVQSDLGRCDLLFSNVGVQHFGSVETIEDDVWQWILNVNVAGTARTVRAFLPLLRTTADSRIAFTASANVLAPAARLGAYQASKAAVVALAETLRLELATDGISVSVVYPSGMLTRHLESSAAARPKGVTPAAPGGVTQEDLEAMMNSRPMSELDLADADVAAANALAGVLAGEPHVITHGDLAPAVMQHTSEIDAALGQLSLRQPRTDRPEQQTGEAGVEDIEAIKRLKGSYFRLMDTKDWSGFRALFTPDVTIDVSADGAGVFEGLDAFMQMLEPTLGDVVTVHHGHTPEIALTSVESASGIWAMEDHLRFPESSGGLEIHGYGHYYDTYVKQEGRWLIASQRLTRLRLDVTPP